MIHTFLEPLVESQLESFLSIIISFLVQLQHFLLPSLIVTSSQVRVGMPLPLLLCCISGLGPEGLRHFQTKHKAWVELNFFEYSDSKKYYSVEYSKRSKPQYDHILGTKTMEDLGIVLDFKAKMIIIDEIILLMRNINNLQGTSMLHALKLNHSLTHT
jgi:hypothetical protein